MGERGCAKKNLSLTSTKDKAPTEYIRGRQPSPYDLAFGVGLGQNPHSKMAR